MLLLVILGYIPQAICAYSIGDYQWLLVAMKMIIFLVAISGYFINGYCDYSINDYYYLFYQWLLVGILLMIIDGQITIGYW